MPVSPSQAAKDRATYIPPQIEQAMKAHIEATMPAQYKPYLSDSRPGLIPTNVEQKLSTAMQKNMPAHLKPYAGAYMQQRIVQPGSASSTPSSIAPHPPSPDLLRRDHSAPAQQYTVEPNTLPVAAKSLFEAKQTPPSSTPVAQPNQPPVSSPGPYDPGYAFIMNPSQPPKRRVALPSVPGLGPLATKVLIGLAGLVLVLIIFSVTKSALSGSGNVPALTAVAQDQQELAHLSTNAALQTDISTTNQTFAATASLSLASAEAQLISYLSLNGHKLAAKQLSLKVSVSTDSSLTAAESTGNFNQTFVSIMQSKLGTYMSDLNTAYKLTKGAKGRALLVSDYKQAQLLLSQLSAS